MTTAFDFAPGFNVKPAGYQQLTNANLAAAVGLTSPAVNKATAAYIQNDPTVASPQAVRWRDDGTAPDANTGMVLQVGETLVYTGDLTAIQFIRVASGAQVNVSYYKLGHTGE